MTDSVPTTILIVDDEPQVRDLLARWLTAEGYRCVEASHVAQARRRVEEEHPLLVLLDITMPGGSGLELLAYLREHSPHTAVLMVTAVTDRATAVRALSLGAYGYVIKPFGENEILINVAGALERRRLVLLSEEHEQQLEERIRERTAEVRRREGEIAVRLISASEYRHEETGAHLRRMGLYVAHLAENLGWVGTALDDLRVAAAMHDIGKIGVPDGILLKPGPLSPEEFEEVKKHALIGAKILDGSDVPLLNLARDIALAHHEQWGGGGYPRRLAGEAIPAAARLVAIADVYDALVTDRVYRPAFSESEALAIMRDGRGTRFEPAMFDCFVDVLPWLRAISAELTDEAPGSLTVLRSAPPDAVGSPADPPVTRGPG